MECSRGGGEHLHKLPLVEASVMLQGFCPERTLLQREASSIHSASSNRRRICRHHTVVHQRELSEEINHMLKLHPYEQKCQQSAVQHKTGTEHTHDVMQQRATGAALSLPVHQHYRQPWRIAAGSGTEWGQ